MLRRILNSSFGRYVSFCEYSFFREDFPFISQGSSFLFFLMLVVYARDSLKYLETSLFPFFGSARMGDLDVYKG